MRIRRRGRVRRPRPRPPSRPRPPASRREPGRRHRRPGRRHRPSSVPGGCCCWCCCCRHPGGPATAQRRRRRRGRAKAGAAAVATEVGGGRDRGQLRRHRGHAAVSTCKRAEGGVRAHGMRVGMRGERTALPQNMPRRLSRCEPAKARIEQPRPGVEPGDPRHEAEGWTRCPRGRENSAATQRVAQVFLYGKAKTPPK